MKPRISIVTLGVKDFDRARSFYRDGLGFPLRAESNESVAFFELDGRMVLALFDRNDLAHDAFVPSEGTGFRGFSLAHNVSSEEEVDRTLEQAVAAGATLNKAGQKVFWGGYSGYFSDPEGFLWEVAYNPFMDLA